MSIGVKFVSIVVLKDYNCKCAAAGHRCNTYREVSISCKGKNREL